MTTPNPAIISDYTTTTMYPTLPTTTSSDEKLPKYKQTSIIQFGENNRFTLNINADSVYIPVSYKSIEFKKSFYNMAIPVIIKTDSDSYCGTMYFGYTKPVFYETAEDQLTVHTNELLSHSIRFGIGIPYIKKHFHLPINKPIENISDKQMCKIIAIFLSAFPELFFRAFNKI